MATHPELRYVVWQIEAAPTTGRLHAQAYVEATKLIRFGSLKNFIGGQGMHVEGRLGTAEQNRSYCMKPETRVSGPWEKGVRSHQGKRTDLLLLKRDLDQGVSMLDVSNAHFGAYLSLHRGIEAYVALRAPQRDWATELHILWGETGCGKSWDATEAAQGGERIYRLRRPNQRGGAVWWDGYDGQEVVIIDEFSGWLFYGMLLMLADRYPLLVDVKGGSVSFCARRIYITSNLHPMKWYSTISKDTAQWSALDRRVTSCTYYRGRYPDVVREGHSVKEWVGTDTETSYVDLSEL